MDAGTGRFSRIYPFAFLQFTKEVSGGGGGVEVEPGQMKSLRHVDGDQRQF